MDSRTLLGPDGPLHERLPDFTPRAGQRELAARIERALADDEVFIAESGTGTGKTFAYLVPALLSGKKILVSTGTKNLQDQLFHRDLPVICSVLPRPVSRALLKGRANYLCRYRLEQTGIEGRFTSREQAAEWVEVQAWAGRTRSGDIGELTALPEDSPLWPRVTSTAENCLGSNCEYYGECFVNKARREALAADVLVINHHLFFADMALREEGFAQLLPGVDAVIFDEAHQLPEIATRFFGRAISSRQIHGLCGDIRLEDLRNPSGVEGLDNGLRAVEKASADLRLAFGTAPVRREAWSAVADESGVSTALSALADALQHMAATLELAAGHSQGLANAYRRAVDVLDRLDMFQHGTPPDMVAWFETTRRGFILSLSPLSVADSFREQVAAAPRAWVFTSATLAIDGDFGHFQTLMGLEHAATGCWDSPFDYASQSLLYIPTGLPLPSHPDYTRAVVAAALPVLRASGGRAFLLFTSYRALNLAAELLEAALDYPLLVQGSAPRPELLNRFRAAGNAVLLGTSSFWEGVDVRGEALSCVIIDKLPFAAPDDPILRARAEALAQDGLNPFTQYQVPSAVITLKQGAGRLIRDENDRGVLVLCDPRLLGKAYGRTFLRSLPPMRMTRALEDVEDFFGTAPGVSTASARDTGTP